MTVNFTPVRPRVRMVISPALGRGGCAWAALASPEKHVPKNVRRCMLRVYTLSATMQALLLSERFREIGWNAAESRRTPPRHAALRDDPAALALRLFRDGLSLSDSELSVLFGGAEVPLGLIVRGAAAYRTSFAEDLFLFSDWSSADPREVLPPGETSAILFRAARPLARGGRILDLCCGSGTLALLLGNSIGTDLNEHAIMLANLNAAINGIRGVEFRQGSLFEPVAAERFDLIVCQPPFVPRAAGKAYHMFLHGGERGDELAREILERIPEYLAPYGSALMYSDWPLTAGEALVDRIPHAGMRARLFASPPITVESYCQSYGWELEEHFSQMGIVGVRQCLAVLSHGCGVEEREVLPHEWREILLGHTQ